MKVKEQLSEKDQEVHKEKAKKLIMQRDLDKLQSKLKDCNDYIRQLPTIEEVATNKQNFEEQKAEMDGLRGKIKELETKVVSAKKSICEKNRDVKQAQDLCKSLQSEKECELMSQCEENASIRDEFELAKKMILKCEEEKRSQQVKYIETQIEELKEAKRIEQVNSSNTYFDSLSVLNIN